MNKQTKLSAVLARRNARFAKLTKAQQRVAIAKDVLAQMRAKKIMAKSGVYFVSSSNPLSGLKKDDQVQVGFEKMESCRVCAIGAAFVCAVRLGNDLTVGEVGMLSDDKMMRERLGKHFTKKQMWVMERVFENCYPYRSKPARFYRKHMVLNNYGDIDHRKSGPKLLTAIMKNIIENDGTFKP